MGLGQVLADKEDPSQAPRHMEHVQPNAPETAGCAYSRTKAEEKAKEHKYFEDTGPENQLVELILNEGCELRLKTLTKTISALYDISKYFNNRYIS